MSYHAIGKEAWEDLPGIFDNPELADTLDCDTQFWAYTYTFDSVAQPGKRCVMNAGVSYSKLTGRFTKYLQSEQTA